jgi:hypothetical protein
MRISERSTAERDRDNARAQLRTQLANHATGVFVALNAGGLAAALAWLQSLPMDAEAYSCNGVLLRTIPWAAALLVVGVIATATSYLLRYRAVDPGRVQRGWMVALSLSAAALTGAGILVSYTALNCREIGVEQRRRSDVDFDFKMARFQGRSDDDVLNDARLRSKDSERNLEYAIAEAAFRERLELEQRIQRLQELRSETIKRIDYLGPSRVSKGLAEELERINRLDKELQAQLSD